MEGDRQDAQGPRWAIRPRTGYSPAPKSDQDTNKSQGTARNSPGRLASPAAPLSGSRCGAPLSPASGRQKVLSSEA